MTTVEDGNIREGETFGKGLMRVRKSRVWWRENRESEGKDQSLIQSWSPIVLLILDKTDS